MIKSGLRETCTRASRNRFRHRLGTGNGLYNHQLSDELMPLACLFTGAGTSSTYLLSSLLQPVNSSLCPQLLLRLLSLHDASAAYWFPSNRFPSMIFLTVFCSPLISSTCRSSLLISLPRPRSSWSSCSGDCAFHFAIFRSRTDCRLLLALPCTPLLYKPGFSRKDDRLLEVTWLGRERM